MAQRVCASFKPVWKPIWHPQKRRGVQSQRSFVSLQDQIKQAKQDILAELKQASTLEALERVRVRALGKKGELTQFLRSMGSVDPHERPKIGKLVNDAQKTIEESLAHYKQTFEARELEQRIAKDALDITLPARTTPLGSLHVITQIVEEIEDLFVGLGYSVADGPYVETEYYNFTALNAPADHPSRSPHDTFYIADAAQETGEAQQHSLISDVLLRTQTSPVQMRTMEAQKPPIYMICPGKVFRPDTADASHLPQFTQIEGLVVDEGISFADLKGTLDLFATAIFGEERATRYRPHFFPFTEPSAELDVSCAACGGKGCSFCKGTGWIEVLGCGMVDVAVLQNAGIDPERYSGFAFGIGAARIACLRYGIGDIRQLVTGDMRFLRQF